MIFYSGTASLPYTAVFTYKDGTVENISGTWTGTDVYD